MKRKIVTRYSWLVALALVILLVLQIPPSPLDKGGNEAWGQELQRSSSQFYVWSPDTLTDSCYYSKTLQWRLPKNWPLGKVLIPMRWDSLSGGITDSLLVQCRPWDPEEQGHTVYYGDGAAADWQSCKVYEGNTVWSDWTRSTVLHSGAEYWLSFEMGGCPWSGVEFYLQVWDSTANKEGKFNLTFPLWYK
jgi:hypothetical protein